MFSLSFILQYLILIELLQSLLLIYGVKLQDLTLLCHKFFSSQKHERCFKSWVETKTVPG